MTHAPKLGTLVPIMGTNDSQVASALFGKTRREILALLYGRAGESFYLRQIVQATATGQGAVQRELKRLSEAGIIERFERGRQVYFQANSKCPIYEELRGLVIKTAGLADVLKKAFAPVAKNIDMVFIFGSQADGTATATSDVDLLVVGDIDEILVHRVIGKAEGKLGRSVNYTLLGRNEFERRKMEKDGFLSRVLSGARITIVGDSDEV